VLRHEVFTLVRQSGGVCFLISLNKIMNTFKNPARLRKSVRLISQAVALTVISVSSYAQSNSAVSLDAVNVTGKMPITLLPTEAAPSQASLNAVSAQSTVSDTFVRNFVSPVADYTQVLSMTPGAFSFTPNGVGLGDAKVTMRGLSDSNTVIAFDGIPFNDTNGVSHHSWTFFPALFLGGATVDRSPGSAATIGQATYGGSFDLRSRVLGDDKRTDITYSSGTWNTRLLNLEHTTGKFGEQGENNLLVNVHEMKSDGYQTYNQQDRKGFSAKFERVVSPDTKVTAFTSYMDLKNNTPNIKGISRADYNNGVYNNLLSGDPTKANYYGYNFYDVPTDFSYVGVQTKLSDGWMLEDKVYRYSYHNKQNYNGTTISATSATDKLNAYVTYGNLLRLSRESALGTLRTGLWIDRSNSNRYQIKSDPRTWVDVAAPNFHETYTTTTVQPYLEHEFKINEQLKVTPGIKYASYKQDFVHDQDNGGAVGPLGGTFNKTTNVITGGAPNIANSVKYTDWLPSLSANYKFSPQWSGYAQYAYGDQIPSTSIFDVPNAKVSPAPKPTKAKAAQVGTVYNSNDLTIGANLYHIDLDGAYAQSSTPDAYGNIGWYLSGSQVSQGVDGEATFALGNGFSLYANAMVGSLKSNTGKWIAGAPRDTETVALNYMRGNWKANFSVSRIGQVYADGTTTAGAPVNEAFKINAVTLANLFVNYTMFHPDSFAKQTKIQLGVNNLFNAHSIVGIASATAGSSSANPSNSDLLTVMPARSVNVTATVSF
jgi:iron complex outermembrane receptor protein